jgi:inosose dehydratase
VNRVISCLTNSYGRFGAQAAIEMVRDAGIEWIELPIRTTGSDSIFGDEPLLSDQATTDQLADLAGRLADHDVRLSSCNVTSGNPLDPDVLAVTLRKLDIAADLGVGLVVGGAGEADSDEDLQSLYGQLRQIGDHAAKLGLTYCFETHPGICQDHGGMIDTMHELEHPSLRINFDTANILYYNEPINGEIALAKTCQWVSHMHLKDSHGEYRDWYFPALGHGGAVDFVRVLDLMSVCGFEGPYSLEIEGIEGEGELTLEAIHQRIVDSVEHLKLCGYFD